MNRRNYIVEAPHGKIKLSSDREMEQFEVYYAVTGNTTLVWLSTGHTNNPSEWIDKYGKGYFEKRMMLAFAPIFEVVA
jgi:hypothetical protein